MSLTSAAEVPSRSYVRSLSLPAAATIFVAAAAMVGTMPGRTHGLGLFTESILKELQLDKVTFGQINLWATLIGAAFCFPAGRLLDRYGNRVVLCGTAILLGATVWWMSGVTGEVPEGPGVGAVGDLPLMGLLPLFLFITLTRGFGQSALSVVSISIIGKSFDRKLVWPTATYSVLMTIGFVIAFPLVGKCIEVYGWRSTWAGIGIALIFVLAPLAWLLPKNSIGPAEAEAENRAAAEAGEGFTLGQALGTPIFWIFALATSLFGLASSGLGLYNAAVLAERGFDFATYYQTLAVSTPFGLLGQAACGYFARSWSYQRLTTVAMALYAAALVCLTFVVTKPQLMATAALLGMSGGMITVIFFAVWNRVFGRRELGRIQGAAQMLTVLASAVGPLLFAECSARTGSYAPILYILAGVVTLLGATALLVAAPAVSASTVAGKSVGDSV